MIILVNAFHITNLFCIYLKVSLSAKNFHLRYQNLSVKKIFNLVKYSFCCYGGSNFLFTGPRPSCHEVWVKPNSVVIQCCWYVYISCIEESLAWHHKVSHCRLLKRRTRSIKRNQFRQFQKAIKMKRYEKLSMMRWKSLLNLITHSKFFCGKGH